MYRELIARYIELVKEFGCAIAIFTENGKILHLNEEALEVFGPNINDLELLPGRYVENEDFWENLKKYRTLFTHKALLKAGTETYKIRGMMHLLNDANEKRNIPATYALAFEVREERLFGSVTLERIIEHSGFVAFHWITSSPETDEWSARYVSNSVSKFGYKREDFYERRVGWNEFVYKEDRTRIREEVLEHLRSGKYEYTREYRITSASGKVIPVHDYVHLVVDGEGNIIGVEIVIFDLLMETERNANIVMVWEIGRDDIDKNNLRYVSSNVEKIGISYSSLRSGKTMYEDYIHPDDKEHVVQIYAQYAQKGYQYLCQEYRIVAPNGQEYWIMDEGALIELPGGQRYVESILTDITKAKHRELQLVKQQDELERKIRYIESQETMLSDMSVIDFISKEDLQNLQSAFSILTNSYNAIIDLDGEPITYPDGPDSDMGIFYDMFERSAYKKGYFELNNKLRREKQPVRVNLSEFAEQDILDEDLQDEAQAELNAEEIANAETDLSMGVMVGLPLFIDDKHMATWINCAFDDRQVKSVEHYIPALWSICKYMAQFVYSNTISQKQAQKARVAELQARELLHRSATVRDILRRCNETNDEDALNYVLSKVGNYLNISRISLFRYNEGEFPACWCEWDGTGMEKHVDWNSNFDSKNYEMQEEAFARDGEAVINGDKVPIRLRRVLWENHIRAIVALPIRTLTRERQYITFVESNYDRVWTEDELSFMHTTVGILQGFLQRMRSNVNVQDVTETQKQFLELSRDYIYIKDENKDNIVYVNPRLEEVIGKDAIGKKCYEVFRRQSIRCMDCYEKRGTCRELCNSRMYSRFFKKPMRVRETTIDWENQPRRKLIMLSEEDEVQ